MNNIRKITEEREQMLAKLIKEKERALKNAPEGSLRANKSGQRTQYYHYTSSANTNGKYLRASEQNLIHALAQKEYDQKILRSAHNEKALLEKLNMLYEKEMIEDVYEKIVQGKRDVINPIVQPRETYIKQWMEQEYDGLKFRDDAPEFYSDKGERMRSKSELLIANALYKNHIPYKYEKPLYLLSYGKVHPDFTILDVENRKEIYWEHLGLMDDLDYREKSLHKLIWYELDGYLLGDSLIITFETSKQPLNSKWIELIINKKLKARSY
ncbi:MAG: hypothetical protein E7299_11505 [Lachnospiraceae bacterium]|nr:hypothetical protein [Lachnospiraceae bacterium]